MNIKKRIILACGIAALTCFVSSCNMQKSQTVLETEHLYEIERPEPASLWQQFKNWVQRKIFAKENVAEQFPLIPRAVLFGNPEKDHVRISPDGTKIAYLAPHEGALNIWVKTLGKDDDRLVTHGVKQGINNFVWAQNNKHILFLQDSNGDEKWHIFSVDLETYDTVDMTPFKGVSSQILQLDKRVPREVLIAMNKENLKLLDVYRLDLETGGLKRVAKNPGDVDVWLADSQLRVRAAVVAKSDGSSELLLRDNDSVSWGKKLTWSFEDSLVGSVPPKGSRPVSFSRDGVFLYLVDSIGANTKRLIKMNLATGEKEILAADDVYDVDTVVINQETYEPDFVSFVRARREWKALNSAFEKDLDIILSTNKGDLTSIDRSSDDAKWILCFEADDKPRSFYAYDRQAKKMEFLFYDRPALTQYSLAPMQPISFTSRDGLTIHGYLTCPQGKQHKNLPLVLFVHGGPWERDVWGFNVPINAQAQLLANRGYACLQVNFRGSAGYGKKFLNAGDKEWGGKMQNDLIDAVNWAVKEGIADKHKIAIYGASYGGYAALVGATFTPDVFRCAVDLWGPTNLITALHSLVSFRPMGKAKWFNRVGNPKTDYELLKSRSPLFKVDHIKIPIFIAQGGNDPRVKQAESEQIVAAMKEKGIAYEYMFFPGEGHGFTRPENRFRLAVAVEKFLATHLGGRFEE